MVIEKQKATAAQKNGDSENAMRSERFRMETSGSRQKAVERVQQRVPERKERVEMEQLAQYLGRENKQRDDPLERLRNGDLEAHLDEQRHEEKREREQA